jgi:dTDP-4-amino-4,6-dideoxygalactose transaminase
LLNTVMKQPQWKGRTEVILPGYTCPALAKVILDAGLTPHLVDIDPLSFSYPPAALSAAVNSATLAIIVVHPFGIPVAMGPALAAARAVGALVIEDAAQAMGARVDGRHVGTRGHVGLYSFGPGKPLALGGGGVLVTSDDRLAEALTAEATTLALPTDVASISAWLRMGLFSMTFQPSMWWLATRLGAQKVGANEASWGYRMTELTPSQAAVGVALLPRLDEINQQRRNNARHLLVGLADIASLSTPGIVSAKSAEQRAMENTKQPIYLRLPLLTSTVAQTETIHAALTAAGIGVGRMYGRTISEFFPQLAATPLPESERMARKLLTLPTNYHLTGAEIARIPEIIRATLTAP